MTQETPNQSGSTESRSVSNPVEQLLGLVGKVDPIELASRAVDASRRTTEAVIGILEGLSAAVDNLNRTTSRINLLLDEVEEPLKRVMPQVGATMNAVATLGEAAGQLGDLAKRLSPLTVLAESAGGLFGMRSSGQGPAPGSTSSS